MLVYGGPPEELIEGIKSPANPYNVAGSYRPAHLAIPYRITGFQMPYIITGKYRGKPLLDY
jgi:hypothetical protein